MYKPGVNLTWVNVVLVIENRKNVNFQTAVKKSNAKFLFSISEISHISWTTE